MTEAKLDAAASEAERNDAGNRPGTMVTSPAAPRIGARAKQARWGVILAGGDGVRLRPLTRLICGDERPKQFCPLFQGQTLLEQTLRRSAVTIPQERILVSLTSHHQRWYSQQAGLQPFQRVVQPANRGTAPPILHCLLSVSRLDPDALVAILPCDHHYANEALFASALECAFETAAADSDSVILLGARPDYPEVEYGWIELGARLGPEESDLFRVRGFWEKPDIEAARRLLAQGSIWNTFVMVGHVQAFLRVVEGTLPGLMGHLSATQMWTGRETRIAHSHYERMPSVSFSHHVLSAETGKLAALRLADVGWSDLGDPGRVVMAARESGREPQWLQRWGLAKGTGRAASKAAAAVA